LPSVWPVRRAGLFFVLLIRVMDRSASIGQPPCETVTRVDDSNLATLLFNGGSENDYDDVNRFLPGYVTDHRMLLHRNIWFPNHIETPERLSSILNLCDQQGLFERMKKIPSRLASLEEIELFHSKEYVQHVASFEAMATDELQKASSIYDSVYACQHSFTAARLAVGSLLNATEAVLMKRCVNAIALVRPPGHHAMLDAANGFCLFNNVGIAAAHALNAFRLDRILIVDWDVHYGQGIQQKFIHSKQILCVSIHRHEFGSFWPHMPESDWSNIGQDDGLGFNVNVPLNVRGLGDADYLAIFHHILLPLAIEFQPQLILVSAGFDAAVGCPEGEMLLSPRIFAHFTKMLASVASGRLVISLEGGYCIPSLSWSVSCVVRALLNDPIPKLAGLNVPVNPYVVDAMLSLARRLKPYWKCMGNLLSAVNATMTRANQKPLTAHDSVFSAKRTDQTEAACSTILETGHVSNQDHLTNVISDIEKLQLHASKNGISTRGRVDLRVDMVAQPYGDFDVDRLAVFLPEKHWRDAFLIQSTLANVSTFRTRKKDFSRCIKEVEDFAQSLLNGVSVCGCLITEHCVTNFWNMEREVSATLANSTACNVLFVCLSSAMVRVERRSVGQLKVTSVAIPFIHDATRVNHNILDETIVHPDCYNVDLLWSVPNPTTADRLFIFLHFLLPYVTAISPELVILNVDLDHPNAKHLAPSLLSFIVSNFLTLANSRLLVSANVPTVSYPDKYIKSSLTALLSALAGCDMPVDTLLSNKLSNYSITMVAELVYQLRTVLPTLQSVLLPVSLIDGLPVDMNLWFGRMHRPRPLKILHDYFCKHLKLNRADLISYRTWSTKTPCKICSNRLGNWVCLICSEVFCDSSVNSHREQHREMQRNHNFFVNVTESSVYCYLCSAECGYRSY
ncbi:Histone deacetylase 10, partial [Trichinella pseudospiralis]